MEVVFLKQSDAVTACGVSQTVFQNRIKSTLKMELRDRQETLCCTVRKDGEHVPKVL
jgi:hypothetical protein